jgi:NAD(P)-dependent dehydrogenase (short-subunit alcohol dehydrogenase family)
MSKILEGKVALVTGGSRGLGVVLAETLADQGADIAISYVASAAKAEAVVEKLKAKGVRAIAIQADQADTATAKPMVERVIAEFGKLDILIANAAIAVQGKTVDDPTLDDAAYDKQWMVNVLGTVAVTRAAARKISDGGRIVFIGSGLGTRALFPGVADYAGTKAAIAGYARGVQRDVGRRNITVNVVQPGIMATDMGAEAAEHLPEALMDMHPIRRIATLEEVAAAVSYLVGPTAGYTAGTVIDVSGGVLI